MNYRTPVIVISSADILPGKLEFKRVKTVVSDLFKAFVTTIDREKMVINMRLGRVISNLHNINVDNNAIT